jgi:hypothetical protein
VAPYGFSCIIHGSISDREIDLTVLCLNLFKVRSLPVGAVSFDAHTLTRDNYVPQKLEKLDEIGISCLSSDRHMKFKIRCDRRIARGDRVIDNFQSDFDSTQLRAVVSLGG